MGVEEGERKPGRERFWRKTLCLKRNIRKYFCFLHCGMACTTLLQRSRVKIYIILQGFWRQIIVSLNVATRQLGLYRKHGEKYVAYIYFFLLDSIIFKLHQLESKAIYEDPAHTYRGHSSDCKMLYILMRWYIVYTMPASVLDTYQGPIRIYFLFPTHIFSANGKY